MLKYLLYHLNNRIIKWQRWNDGCSLLSGLNLSYGCIPFDRMPFCTSLRNHNPRIYDLLDCLSEKGREHELFARHIQNNTEIEGMLFTPQKDIVGFDNIDALISTYNRKLYLPKHEHRKLSFQAVRSPVQYFGLQEYFCPLNTKFETAENSV